MENVCNYNIKEYNEICIGVGVDLKSFNILPPTV